MPNEDEFSSLVNAAPLVKENDLPGSYPTSQKVIKQDLNARYGRFIIGDEGCPELESIMNDCLTGKRILLNEKWYFTKDGDSVVVVKYATPVTKQPEKLEGVIRGRRRLKKALAKEQK